MFVRRLGGGVVELLLRCAHTYIHTHTLECSEDVMSCVDSTGGGWDSTVSYSCGHKVRTSNTCCRSFVVVVGVLWLASSTFVAVFTSGGRGAVEEKGGGECRQVK